MNNINKNEFNFLNNKPKEETQKKQKYGLILDLLIMILSIICNLFIWFIESICKILEVILWGDTAYTIYKTAKGKHKKRKRWF